MKIKLLKPACYADSFWNAGAVINVDKNTGSHFLDMRHAVLAKENEELSPIPFSGPDRKSLETEAMEKAAVSIVNAVTGLANPSKKASKE